MIRLMGIKEASNKFGISRHLIMSFIELTGIGAIITAGKKPRYTLTKETIELMPIYKEYMENSTTVSEAIRKMRIEGVM